MEVIASVAVGLNPYIGAFVLASLAAFSDKVPQSAVLAATPFPVLIMLAALYGMAAPFDFVFGKFVRFAPRVRRASHIVAPATAALAASAVADTQVPTAIVATGAAVLAWLVSVTLTSAAARASRSAMWVGLGHVPVLMAAATAAACILPLGLAKPVIGYVLVALTCSLLFGSSLLSMPMLVPARRLRAARRAAQVAAR